MFLRVVRASGGKGVKHEYLRLVEAYRDRDGKTQHRTILSLGRIDLLAAHRDLGAKRSEHSPLGIGVRCWQRASSIKNWGSRA